jgi:hypothetical protein
MAYLQVATAELTLVQHKSLGDQTWLRELNVGITAQQISIERAKNPLFPSSPFRLARELVQQDCNPVDGTTGLEMSLDLLRRSTVVDITDKDTTRINIFFILLEVLGLLVEGGLHLAQFGSLGFHLSHSALHSRDFFLFVSIMLAGCLV